MSLLAEAKHREEKHDPEGSLREDLDVSRSEIVQLCGEKGQALFSFLLASSTREKNTAVISLTRLSDVALELGWSPDTVKRYVAVFRAINLVSHYHDQRREVKLLLPLGPYTPLSTLSGLDELIGKRTKQRQLALKVKTRYIAHFGDPTQGHSSTLRQTLQQVKAILDDEHLEPLKRERLQMRIAEMITCLAGVEKGHTPEGDLAAASLRIRLGTSFTEGDLDTQQGDFKAQNTPSLQPTRDQEGDSDAQQGDCTFSTSSPSATKAEQTGDSDVREEDQARPTPPQEQGSIPPTQDEKGDLDRQQGDPNTDNEGQIGDLTRQDVLKEGDSAVHSTREVQVNAPYTYNVSYLISNINKGDNVIRKRIAQFLASVLEKSEYDNGYPTFSKYLKAFKYYSPEVIGRAFLATMVLVHRKGWQVDSLGATFTTQCKVLSGQKALAAYTLDEVEEWLRTWGDVSYAELIGALAAPSSSESREPASLVTAPHHRDAPSTRVSGQQGAGSSSMKRGRTYGVHYTGLLSGKRSFNTSGSARPPQPDQS